MMTVLQEDQVAMTRPLADATVSGAPRPSCRQRRVQRVLIMIDQASRDAFSQLLIARYLVRKGVPVLLCNQHTLVGTFERYRPQVIYASWLTGGPLMDYLIRIHRQAYVVLNDQEGGRIGEEPFKRSFKLWNGAKVAVGRACRKVFMWGEAQASWLRDLEIVPSERIIATGAPRFDPYLIVSRAPHACYLGVTLRNDTITSLRQQFMEMVYRFASAEFPHGIGVGYPLESQYEDKIWHLVATTRYQFKIAQAFARRSPAPIIFRPGPWEQPGMYAFLSKKIPLATVEARTLQHEYVRNSFALLDESSSLGLEGLLAGVPVISVQSLIPRLTSHFVGDGGSMFTAPYVTCYWQPTTVEETLDLLAKAQQGQLAPSPDPENLRRYVQACHGWPRKRPSSFQIGDEILELLDRPTEASDPESERTDDHTLKQWIYRYVPGAVSALKLKLICQHMLSADRQLWFRYHYYDTLYPYHREVDAVFKALWARYEAGSNGRTEQAER